MSEKFYRIASKEIKDPGRNVSVEVLLPRDSKILGINVIHPRQSGYKMSEFVHEKIIVSVLTNVENEKDIASYEEQLFYFIPEKYNMRSLDSVGEYFGTIFVKNRILHVFKQMYEH